MASEHELSATAQEYLETIYNIAMEGDPVVGARLAEKFGVAPPSVTAMLQRLARDGYLTLDHRHGAALTEQGMAAAEASLRRHRLAERFLMDMLGMDWITAHEQAQTLQHGLTPAIEAQMVATLGNPTTCPHGNPIPGSAPSARDFLRAQGAMRLRDASVGQEVRVVCVSEVVEDETALLREVGALGLRPGRRLRVTGRDAERTTIEAQGRDAALTQGLAARLWVVADG